MVLKTIVKVSQSKKAWTQYLTIPSAVVQDSQYPFEDGDRLYLEVEPVTGVMIISKEDRPIKVNSEGFLILSEPEEFESKLEVYQTAQVKTVS